MFMRLVHATSVAFFREKTNATEVACTGNAARLFAGHNTRDETSRACSRRDAHGYYLRKNAMNYGSFQGRKASLLAVAATLALAIPVGIYAQGRGGRGPQGPPPPAKQAAPEDLTGYWVAVVTEDWRFRMVTPAKGDYASVPINAEGRKVADAWDPAKDTAAGEQCRSYGAAGLMRVPGRVHITWQDDNTLKVETDAGEQTRLFHFATPVAPGTVVSKLEPPAGTQPSLQGFSVGEWQLAPAPGGGGRGAPAIPPMQRGGSLKVETTDLKMGYLRKNGVPYSPNTKLTEYYSVTHEPNGDQWLIVTTVVDDPLYLQQPFITSTHFKKEADGSKWRPAACMAS
jgi:hypothetical protein